MSKWRPDGLKTPTSALRNALRGSASRKSAFTAFAHKHQLIYFSAVKPEGVDMPVILGSTASTDQVDVHYAIGTHADYDMTAVDRIASVKFESYKGSVHHWYVLQIDLKHASSLPYIFVGTKQQTKAYYAKVLTLHRDTRYLQLQTSTSAGSLFHAHYALLASPAVLPLLYRLFDDETITTMGVHRYPFAIEIDGESVTVITDAKKPSEQLLDELLHYGLWIAKAIDKKLV